MMGRIDRYLGLVSYNPQRTVFLSDGTGKITIDGTDYELHEGESIVMPAKHPHAVFGQEQIKMLLVVIFQPTIRCFDPFVLQHIFMVIRGGIPHYLKQWDQELEIDRVLKG